MSETSFESVEEILFHMKPLQQYFYMVLFIYCGRQEERDLISRFLLRMRCMYVAGIRLDFHLELMEFDHARLWTLVPLVIWSGVFWLSIWSQRGIRRFFFFKTKREEGHPIAGYVGAKAFGFPIVVARTP